MYLGRNSALGTIGVDACLQTVNRNGMIPFFSACETIDRMIIYMHAKSRMEIVTGPQQNGVL